MQNTKLLVAALSAVALLAILIPMPTQAVDPDCTADFTIPTSEPLLSRTLVASSSETGSIQVSAAEVVNVTVKLRSIESVLDFGVFFDNDGTCTSAANKGETNCGAEEKVITSATNAPQSQVCTVDGLTSGMTYYFHFVNPGSSSLDYVAWE